MFRLPVGLFISLSLIYNTVYSAEPIVIIGKGMVSALGGSSNETWNALREGKSGIRKRKDPNATPFPIAAEVQKSDKELESSLRSCPLILGSIPLKIERQSLFAISAASEAIQNAKLTAPSERIGVVLGSSLAGPIGSQRLLGNLFKSQSEVAFALKLDGFSTCVSAACASGLHATILGANLVSTQMVDLMIAGGTEAQTATQIGFDLRNPILSKETSTDIPRVFDRNASGTVLGEGAAVVVLARESYAKENKYPIQGVIKGYSSRIGGEDHTKLKWELVAKTMDEAIKNAGIPKEEIGLVLAHAPGTEGDEAELRALKEVFGNRAPLVPIVSLTSRLGHPLGPSGSMRINTALHILQENFVPGNFNLNEKRPGYEHLHYVGAQGEPFKGGYILIDSFGLTGHYTAMIIGKNR